MNEDKAREIANAKDLSPYSPQECREAEMWVRQFALEQFRAKTRKLPKPYKAYIRLMVRYHFGSMQTNDLLTELDCFPEWMPRR
jgi:hypothetical protein